MTFYLNRPAVAPGDMLDNGQAQAGPAIFSAARLVAAIKTFKNPVQMLLSDAASFVLNSNVNPFPPAVLLNFRPNNDRGTGRAVGNGIVEQIDHSFFQQGRVMNSPEIQRAMEFKAYLLVICPEFTKSVRPPSEPY